MDTRGVGDVSTHDTNTTNMLPFADAYWISSGGDILPVRSSHIAEVIGSPAVFGLSREDVVEAYRWRGEKLGFEGKARGDIMRELLRQGFIRIRYVPSTDAYTVQLWSLTATAKDALRRWAAGTLDAAPRRALSALRVDVGETGTLIDTFTVTDAAARPLGEA